MNWLYPFRDEDEDPTEPEAMLYNLEAIKEEFSPAEDETVAEVLEELDKVIETFTNEGIML